MKTRKIWPPTPPPPSNDPTEVKAAQYIAMCIHQGLPGDYFAKLMNTIEPEKVKEAARLTVHELIDWFKKDQAAREILDQVPQFPQFVSDMHRAAQEMYPDAR